MSHPCYVRGKKYEDSSDEGGFRRLLQVTVKVRVFVGEGVETGVDDYDDDDYYDDDNDDDDDVRDAGGSMNSRWRKNSPPN